MPPPSSSKPAPLPLAPDRAAISNQISLLLSKRTSLLKTLNPASSSPSTTAAQTTRRYNVNPDEIEQLFAGPRPNEGVGYVPDSKTASKDASKEDRMLRGRLLGKKQKNGRGAAAGGKFAVESESDEEPGRSGLGKRKRPKREPARDDNEEEEEKAAGKVEVEDAETSNAKADEDAPAEDNATVPNYNDGSGNDDAKKNKKKKKRQREKQKQKQKQKQKLGNARS